MAASDDALFLLPLAMHLDCDRAGVWIFLLLAILCDALKFEADSTQINTNLYIRVMR
jgi:hypothetical protein